MKKIQIIYKDDTHTWAAIARDPDRPDYIIDTNEYIIMNEKEAILIDPGGIEVFPAVFSAISEEFDPGKVTHIFASHQDPDIISSLALWLDFNPNLRCYISKLWTTFVPHFGGNDKTFIEVPDEGISINFSGIELKAVPAHYLHSAGNFHLYDPVAKILFTGDVGAVILPKELDGLFVEDFDKHIRFAEGFHRRYMGSTEAKRQWVRLVRSLEIDMIAPQHGAIYKGENAQRFLDWFDNLEVEAAWKNVAVARSR